MDIVAAYRLVGTYRGAAAICGTTHKTVRRVIERAEADAAGAALPERKERARNYDPVSEIVAEQVRLSQGRIEAKRLLPAARAAGYAGSDRNFRRLVSTAKKQWRRDHHRGRRPAVWKPGEMLVIDWTDLGGGLHLFAAVLAWSRWRFVRFAADEKAATTMQLIAAALSAAGGVPLRVLADRMGCLRGGIVANVVVPTADYVRFATHYGYAPDWCEGHDPQSKGIVEHLVGYSQRDLVVPLQVAARMQGRAGLSKADVTAANAAAIAWCAEVNAAVHSEICAVPDERLLTERTLLKPLPSLQLDLGSAPVTRKVDRLSCVRFASARYSVPTRLIGHRVVLEQHGGADGDRLLIVDPDTGEVVAEHALAAPGEASVQDAHYDTPRSARTRAPRARTIVEKRFLALGPDAEAFLVGAAAAAVTRLPAELADLLALHDAHGRDAFLPALRRAVAFRRWRAADVRSILAAGLGAPTPRPAGNALAGDAAAGLPAAPVRSLADYAPARLHDTTPQEATR